MSLALTITDNADGTGAVATVAGSAAGASNVVKVAPWTAGSLTFTDFGPRTGDGTQALSLSNGYHVAYVESTDSGVLTVSNVVTFATTGGDTYTAIHKALAESVKATIQGMLGTDIIGPAADSVRVRKVPYLDDFATALDGGGVPVGKAHALPGIVICYTDEKVASATNKEDELEYPLAIVFFRQNNATGGVASEDAADPFLKARETVERTFTHLRGVSGQKITVTANGNSYTFFDCRTSFGTLYDMGRFFSAAGSLDCGWLKLGFVTWREGGA